MDIFGVVDIVLFTQLAHDLHELVCNKGGVVRDRAWDLVLILGWG